MNPILKYQYDQIIKQLLLLQDHAAMRLCPYSPKGEFCIWKHLLALEAYVDETEPMEDEPARKQRLETLESEARSLRADEEGLMNGRSLSPSHPLEDWARQWRKSLEPVSLFILTATPEGGPTAGQSGQPEPAPADVPLRAV